MEEAKGPAVLEIVGYNLIDNVIKVSEKIIVS